MILTDEKVRKACEMYTAAGADRLGTGLQFREMTSV